MGLVIAGFAPHPPLLIPDIGGAQLEKVSETRDNLKELARRVKESGAESLVIISPHGPVMQNAVAVLVKQKLSGDFAKFGAWNVKLTFETDRELYDCLEKEAQAEGLRIKPVKGEGASVFASGGELDHGVTVPLYYLQEQGVELPGLVMAFSMEPYPNLYHMGKALQKAINKSGKKTAVIASGDLSHRLTKQAPAGYDPRGEEFDRTLINLLREYRVEEILNMEHALIERAGECGFRSLVILLGCLSGLPVKPEVLSYEGPFGVGYLVASFSLEQPQNQKKSATGADPLKLARDSLEYYLKHGRKMPLPASLPEELLEQRGGAFVSLKKNRKLRGCIGTIVPSCRSLGEEIAVNAVKAGFEDPRFPPLESRELSLISLSVDVLSPLEKVEDSSQLDPKKYGVLVRSKGRSGVLLPDLEGVDTVEEQLKIALDKGGISLRDNYEIYRFTVTRYTEEQQSD